VERFSPAPVRRTLDPMCELCHHVKSFSILILPFRLAKAQHLLDLAHKVETTRRTQWLRNQVLVELFWRQSF
jgi:hypothetical protein